MYKISSDRLQAKASRITPQRLPGRELTSDQLNKLFERRQSLAKTKAVKAQRIAEIKNMLGVATGVSASEIKGYKRNSQLYSEWVQLAEDCRTAEEEIRRIPKMDRGTLDSLIILCLRRQHPEIYANLELQVLSSGNFIVRDAK